MLEFLLERMRCMAPERRDPSTEEIAHRFGRVGRCFNQPKSSRPSSDSADSSRMGDEGWPNASASVDDATGYSREEEIEPTMGEEAS